MPKLIIAEIARASSLQSGTENRFLPFGFAQGRNDKSNGNGDLLHYDLRAAHVVKPVIRTDDDHVFAGRGGEFV